MRLHHLEVTAFGPFADTVEVDFDALSDAGLFLLTGATGAGKTSVLDAVCFALYGAVPGDRQQRQAAALRPRRRRRRARGRRWRSPSPGGRFRIVRSPAWERPKKRGTGTTSEQASVLSPSGVDGALGARCSTRLDEAGHLVSPGCSGMNIDPVLPGRDAAAGPVPGVPAGPLRRAPPAAAAAVPHRPVRGRRALAARPPVALRRDVRRRPRGVADLVSRVSEAADQTRSRRTRRPRRAGRRRALQLWAGALVESAATERDGAVCELKVATSAAAIAESAREAGQLLAHRQARHAAARGELSRLDRAEIGYQRAVHLLAASARASRALPAVTTPRPPGERDRDAGRGGRCRRRPGRAGLVGHGPRRRLPPDDPRRRGDRSRGGPSPAAREERLSGRAARSRRTPPGSPSSTAS